MPGFAPREASASREGKKQTQHIPQLWGLNETRQIKCSRRLNVITHNNSLLPAETISAAAEFISVALHETFSSFYKDKYNTSSPHNRSGKNMIQELECSKYLLNHLVKCSLTCVKKRI